jgi:hypothetical protein
VAAHAPIVDSPLITFKIFNQMVKKTILLCSLLAIWSCSDAEEEGVTKFAQVQSELPTISGFMIQPDSTLGSANWLGRPTADGRELLEPINLIVVDESSTSAAESQQKLIREFSEAGFAPRFGHSSGYWGKMNGTHFPQTPSQTDMAFADYMWTFTNNHTRMFGPFKSANFFIWIGSSSTEKGVIHDYVSFNRSLQFVVDGLVKAGNDLLGTQSLNNQVDSQTQHTGDHNGNASVIYLK